MFEFAFTTSGISSNLSKGMGPAQSAEEHGYKLALTRESPPISPLRGEGRGGCLHRRSFDRYTKILAR
jgi:hypothetical protein